MVDLVTVVVLVRVAVVEVVLVVRVAPVGLLLEVQAVLVIVVLLPVRPYIMQEAGEEYVTLMRVVQEEPEVEVMELDMEEIIPVVAAVQVPQQLDTDVAEEAVTVTAGVVVLVVVVW